MLFIGRRELLDEAKRLNIVGRHKMRVQELRDAVKNASNPPPPKEDNTEEKPPVEEKEPVFSWYWWVCEKLGWRNPLALVLVTAFEYLLYGYFRNGMKALLPMEMAGPFALLLSLMSWAYVSGAIGNHRPGLRWSTYGLIVVFRVYFEFYTVYGVMNESALTGEANGKALTAWSVIAADARKLNSQLGSLNGELQDADQRMKEEERSGRNERWKTAVKERTTAASKVQAMEATWTVVEPLLKQPNGTPTEIYNSALELYAACGATCTAPERQDFIDTEHEVSFLLPVESLVSGNQTAWATLMIVIGLSSLAWLAALNVEIPAHKRKEE